jgi:hypothetical protein
LNSPNAVDVKGRSTTLTESVLHRGLLGVARARVVEPVGVDCTCGASQREAVTSAGIVLVQDVNLRRDLRVARMIG